MKSSSKFTPEKWENLYQGTAHDVSVPYTDTITSLLRYFNGNLHGKRILEIGCGVGQNILFISWYFGARVWGMDFSDSAIKKARNRFAEKKIPFEDLCVADIAQTHFEDDFFDAIIERGVIQHNNFQHAKSIVSESRRILKHRGLFTCSLANENHFRFGKGVRLENGTFNNPNEDGLRHFFSKSEVIELFADFRIHQWKSNEYFDCVHNRFDQASFILDLIKE